MIIAISGGRGNGKTTFANRLVSVYGFKKVAFADKLKDIARSIVPFTEVDFSVSRKEKPYFANGQTPRDFLINLGQMMRYYDELFWVKAVGLDKIRGNVVVDDLRFKNEASYLKGLGAVLVRLERFKHLNPYQGEITDSSEHDLDDYKEFDLTIHAFQNQTMTDLNAQVDKFVKDFVKK